MLLSTELISSLLQDLYAAAAEPGQFQGFLERVQQVTDSSRAYMVLNAPVEGNSIAVASNWDPYYAQLYAEHFAQNDPLVTRAVEAVKRNGADWVGDRRELWEDKEYLQHISYQEMVAPVGDLHLCGTMMQMPGGYYSSFVLRRLRHQAAFDADVYSLVNILRPHLKQALALHSQLLAERAGREAMEVSVKAFGVAVISIDSRCRVQHLSAAAETILTKGGGMTLQDGELRLQNREEQTKLRGLIASAVSTGRGDAEAFTQRLVRFQESAWGREGNQTAGTGGAMSITRTPPLPALRASVLPFASPVHLLHDRPAALLFLHDAAQPPSSRGQALRAIYGISPTHARLADLLLRGLSLREAADSIGIAETTARFHLKSIFRTMGISGQGELLRLMLSLPGSE